MGMENTKKNNDNLRLYVMFVLFVGMVLQSSYPLTYHATCDLDEETDITRLGCDDRGNVSNDIHWMARG